MASVTDEIKDKIDIVELIGSSVQLRKSGRSYLGFCPFHANTRTPAFYVYPESQSFHCFGCKASGTVFDFVMRREGLEFKDALTKLAERAGITLHERTPQEDQQDQLRTRLLEVNTAAAAFFHHVLVKSQRGDAARDYVRRRAIDQPTIEAFQLGYAVDDWSALLSYLTDRRGFSADDLVAAGLAIERESGGHYDRFRNRLMFPIRNPKGEIIAFGGRALGDAQPKYMNSPQTPLFDKGRVLYGMDLARESIRASEAVTIVEGYVDVIIAHQHGFKNVVAPLGTALTADHVALLKKQAKTVYLALDADAAGVRATLKGLQILQENPDGELVAVPSAQGIIGFQRKVDIEIKIIELPDGRDPDEVIQADADVWRAAVANARPAMDFYIRAFAGSIDLTNARAKAEAVTKLAPLIGQVANQVERAHYVQLLARTIDIEERHVLASMGQQSRREIGRPGGREPQRAAPPAAERVAPRVGGGRRIHEETLLSLLLRYPEASGAVRAKIDADLTPFPLVAELIDSSIAGLFDDTELRAIWAELQRRPVADDADGWAASLDAPLDAVTRHVLAIKLPQSQSYRFVNDALECATILQQELAKVWKDRLAQQIALADVGEQETVLDQIVQIKQYLGMLSTPPRSSAYSDLYQHTSST